MPIYIRTELAVISFKQSGIPFDGIVSTVPSNVQLHVSQSATSLRILFHSLCVCNRVHCTSKDNCDISEENLYQLKVGMSGLLSRWSKVFISLYAMCRNMPMSIECPHNIAEY